MDSELKLKYWHYWLALGAFVLTMVTLFYNIVAWKATTDAKIAYLTGYADGLHKELSDVRTLASQGYNLASTANGRLNDIKGTK